jgi:orotidine-5'-phosphate decarboxylase
MMTHEHADIVELDGIPIIIKGNTMFRLLGAPALMLLVKNGFKIFGDYKLFDVRDTVKNDVSWLRLIPNLAILTIAEHVHPETFATAQVLLPETIIAAIHPLTDLGDGEFKQRGERSREYAVRTFFKRVQSLSTAAVICAPRDIPQHFIGHREIITPAVRPDWAVLPGDKNAINALTPRAAILAGATKLVLGSPLRVNDDLRGNTLRVLDEIGEAIIERNGL